jgi:hypothetical protein
MKRLLKGSIVGLTLVLVAAFAATNAPRGGLIGAPVAATQGAVSIEKDETNPWTNLTFNNDPETFRFAVVSDRTGGHRPGVFPRAVRMINMLQPEFVMSVGDLIEGHTEDPGQWAMEWSEFEAKLDALQMPFFFCPGNHDITNFPMGDNWRRKFGRSYYSFVYRNVLFMVLNSEDFRAKEQPYHFTPDQQEWVRATLRKHPQVRWTFVFFHKPVWRNEEADPVKLGWTPVEEALQADNRRYTVFVGHEHHYAKFIRGGREYFMLATTGGGSRLRGTEYGEFDQVAWVTMKGDAPVVANVLLEGVQPNDVITEADLPKREEQERRARPARQRVRQAAAK